MNSSVATVLFAPPRKSPALTTMARFFPKLARELATSGIKRSKVYRGSPDAFRKAFSAWLDPDLLPSPYFFTRALFTPQIGRLPLGRRFRQVGIHAFGPAGLPQATRQSRPMDRFTRISWLEMRSYLVNTLLRDTDGMSMHHSLEVRVPIPRCAAASNMCWTSSPKR